MTVAGSMVDGGGGDPLVSLLGVVVPLMRVVRVNAGVKTGIGLPTVQTDDHKVMLSVVLFSLMGPVLSGVVRSEDALE